MASQRQVRVATIGAFAGLGVTASTFPALIPSRVQQFGPLALHAAPALFTGLLVGVVLASLLLPRVRALRITAAGVAVQAAALALVLTPSDIAFLCAAALGGIGFGLTETGASLVARALASGSTAGMLSHLTGVVAVSAALIPLILGALLHWSSPAPLVFAAAAGLAVVAALLWRGQLPDTAGASEPRAGSIWPLIAPVAVVLALFVGAESVLSGWSAVIVHTLASLDPSAAAVGTSAFWALMALGRFTFAAILRRGAAPRTTFAVGMSAATALLVAAAVLVTPTPILALGCVALAVVAFAPGYATLIGIALDEASDSAAPRVVGILVASGALGGALLPSAVLSLGAQPATTPTFLILAGATAVVGVLTAVRAR